MTTEELNEAPASVTLSVITPAGYNALFTVRDTQVSELIKKIGIVEETFTKLGYKPQPSRTFGAKKEKEYTDYPCPVCGSKVEKVTTNSGKIKEVCEKQVYNWQTKTTSGCSYIKWL